MVNKRADLSMDKLVILILAVVGLIVLLVAIFYFNVDVLDWLRGLPEYTYEGDREINYTDLPPDRLALYGCTERIAMLGKEDIASWGDTREILMFPGERKAGLHAVYKKENNFLIKVADKNIDVGKIEDGRLEVKKEIIGNYGIYGVAKAGVSLEDLKLLNGSTLLGRLLCKTRQETVALEQEKIKVSSAIEIYFNCGWDDLVIVRWNFGKNKPEIVLRPNKKKILRNGQEVWIDDRNDVGPFLEQYKRESNFCDTHLKAVESLLTPKSPSAFSERVEMILNGEDIYTYDGSEKDESLSLEEVNKRLYGGDPDILFKEEEKNEG